jgi:transcriptional regulator with XRE-family HTH domain
MPTKITPPAAARPRLLTRRQAAEMLNVSMGTLARWAGERRGPPFVKLVEGEAGSVRYPLDLLDDYLAQRLKSPKDGHDGRVAK